MKNLAKILLCGLFVPVNAVFAVSHSLYYDIGGICDGTRNSTLWCADEPTECCSGNNRIYNLPDAIRAFNFDAGFDGYELRGWTSSSTQSVEVDSGPLSGLVIDKNSVLTGNINASMTLRPAWAKKCVNADYCTMNIQDDGTVSYTPKCASLSMVITPGTSGAEISCQPPEPDINYYNITYNAGSCGNLASGVASVQVCDENSGFPLYANGNLSVDEDKFFIGWKNGDTYYMKQSGGIYACSGDVYDLECWHNVGMTLECNSDLTFTAECGQKYFTHYFGGDHGAIDANSLNTASYCNSGTKYELAGSSVVRPEIGWKFSYWSVGGVNAEPHEQVDCGPGVENIVAVYEKEERDPEPQWLEFALEDDVDNLEDISSPNYFFCQMNPQVNGCYGCYTSALCKDDNKFNGLTLKPYLEHYDYNGHWLTDRGAGGNFGTTQSDISNQIIRSDGTLTDNWRTVDVPEGDDPKVTIKADWTRRKVTINYDYSLCGRSGCNYQFTCNDGEQVTLPSTVATMCVADGYKFANQWIIGGTNSPVDAGAEHVCSSDLQNVKANCVANPKSGGAIDLIGYDKQ